MGRGPLSDQAHPVMAKRTSMSSVLSTMAAQQQARRVSLASSHVSIESWWGHEKSILNRVSERASEGVADTGAVPEHDLDAGYVACREVGESAKSAVCLLLSGSRGHGTKGRHGWAVQEEGEEVRGNAPPD